MSARSARSSVIASSARLGAGWSAGLVESIGVAARETARHERSELITQGEDGQIRERNSYGNDPHPPKG